MGSLAWKLERERMGRRDRHPVRLVMNCFIAGWVYQIPVKNELIRELRRNGSLRRLVGIESICTEPGVPICDEGSKMRYAGRDGDYLKWRCPAVLDARACACRIDNCSTSAYGRVLKVKIADDPRRFPGLSRDSRKWKRLYRRRGACERVNGRLKNYLLLDQQQVRGQGKVTVQVAMSLLVMLASAISMAKWRSWTSWRT